ncbi:hypothetical protein CkaCkLH20_11870 [Colletotrichum karsti]|uniref:AA1-like domain-containing protein n=1 Tax=Colletotrichum karsti TaxID=1095194 RepID=A0A9P6HUJ9_9PEZI|nr:uncharacterized protein CkaCkLH20_11870 [Colletotrichum karsti]KAF9870564.1 hypothetical protein CkaCkLH20_11870 [Colletotrichum karsti]
MKFTVIAALATIASAAPATERRATWTQYFTNVVAEPQPYNNSNLTFAFNLAFTDGTNYHCATSFDTNTGVSANNTCTRYGQPTDVTATVAVPGGIQNIAPYVYIPGIDTTYTADITTADPQYTCAHSGTPGSGVKCISGSGTFTATAV